MAILCKLNEIQQAKTIAVHCSLLTSEPVSEALRLSTGLVLSNCKWMAVKPKDNAI
jgi:hypothetical protein